MKKKYISILSIVLLLIIFSAISCRFPYKIVPNLPSTLPPSETAIVQLLDTLQPTVEITKETPIPEQTTAVEKLEPEAGSVLTWNDYSNFVFIPGGEFIMGKDSSVPADFSPAHKISLDGFWIQQAEVTNQQYAQCVSDGKCDLPVQESKVPYWYEDAYDANHPVVGVTWFQANQYCSYIHSRLPTESEWEITARGQDGKSFPWGGDKPNCNYLNFNGCLEPAKPYDIRSFPFGTSDFGAMDMAGNVFEWVNDWYVKDYYLSSPSINPTGPLDGWKKVYRGGSYNSSEEEIGSYLRFALEPEKQTPDLGFRCVLQGDPLTDPTLKIVQPCQIIGVNDQNQIQPTSTPFPCSPASVTGFCQLLSGKPSYGLDIRQSGCLENKLFSMTGNSQPLTCTISQLSDGGNKYLCTFPGMAQGIKVDVNYCHAFTLPLVKISCPTGYQLNQNSKFCEIENAKLPKPPCPQGYLEVPSYGCLPILEANTSVCPIGFYSINTTISSVCMPLNKCLLSIESDSCQNVNCNSGQKFDSNKNCCISVNNPKKTCSTNLIYNFDQNVCLGNEFYIKKCPVSNIKIPYCPTLTPTATSTPFPKSLSCSDITDYDVCIKNGCNWAFGFFYCY